MKYERIAQVLGFVEERMAAILERPDGWGAPESVELQVLLLVEMRHTVLGMAKEHVDRVNDRYQAFLDKEVPGRPTSLGARLGLSHRATPGFVAVLQRFVQAELQVNLVSFASAPGLPRTDRPGAPHLGEA
jgi:hypothetical protein